MNNSPPVSSNEKVRRWLSKKRSMWMVATAAMVVKCVEGTPAAPPSDGADLAFEPRAPDALVARAGTNIGVNWPHHIFVNQAFKVVGAEQKGGEPTIGTRRVSTEIVKRCPGRVQDRLFSERNVEDSQDRNDGVWNRCSTPVSISRPDNHDPRLDYRERAVNSRGFRSAYRRRSIA